MTMDLTVYLLVIGVTLASARHTLDANLHVTQSHINPSYSFDNQHVERRNIEYISDKNLNREPERRTSHVISDQRQQNAGYSYVTESDHVALISEKVDGFNNIGNDENEFKLRTNAYPIKQNEIAEYTTESVHRQNTNRESSARHGGSEGILKHEGQEVYHNKPPITRSGFSAGNISQKPDTLSVRPIQRPNKSGLSGATDLKHNQVRTKSTTVKNKVTDGSVRLPKDNDEEENPWVWGSDPNENTTPMESLDDRAAFDGASCATGYVKVMGVCVEKH